MVLAGFSMVFTDLPKKFSPVFPYSHDLADRKSPQENLVFFLTRWLSSTLKKYFSFFLASEIEIYLRFAKSAQFFCLFEFL